MSMLLRTLIREILLEKRRMPVEDRIKEESIDVLDEYVDKGFFFHLTDDYKLQGVNVRSDFDTPMGIYVYPLTSEFYKDEKIIVPFGENRKYVIIYKPKLHGKFAYSSSYSNNDLINDGHNLGFDDKQINFAKENAKYDSEPLSALMYLLYADNIDIENTEFTKQNGVRATKRLRKLGYNGMFDNKGVGVIHENEPIQAFFVGSDVCEIVKIINNPKVAKEEHEERILNSTKKKLASLSDKKLIDEIKKQPDIVKFLSFERSTQIISQLFEDELKNIFQSLKQRHPNFISALNVNCYKRTPEYQLWLAKFELKNKLLSGYNFNLIQLSGYVFDKILLYAIINGNNIGDLSYIKIVDKFLLSPETGDAITKYCQFKDDSFQIDQIIHLLRDNKKNIKFFKEKIKEGLEKNKKLDKKTIQKYVKHLQEI